jgi:RNA polymerase sigma-70 factor (ECF subfamily)
MLVPGPVPLEHEIVHLFTQLRNPLLRYVSGLGLPPADGEEVVQEVFLALFQHLRLGKPRTNLKGWVFRVGHNLALKQRMRNGRRERLYGVELDPSEPPAPDLNPEEHFAGIQHREKLLAVIETLPELDRCCLYLRAEGLRYRQIAEVLDISLGGVAELLGRTLARLHRVEGYSR